jgi:hypothetical protein
VGEAPIYIEKGVAAPAPETNHKWLERTREGGPCVLRQFDSPIGGISALEFGYELQPDSTPGRFTAPPLPDFTPIVHVNLKPANS